MKRPCHTLSRMLCSAMETSSGDNVFVQILVVVQMHLNYRL
jgi:hypothetical protein